MSERLIKVRLDHPIARCMELAAALKQRYDLGLAEVAPTDPASTSTTLGIATTRRRGDGALAAAARSLSS